MTRRLFTSIIATAFFLCANTTFGAERSAPIRVACIGDSITFGASIKDRVKNSYPAQLGVKLGKGYEVKNFGVNASTLLKKGSKPYWKLKQFKAAQDYKPNIVIIKLGTNDTKASNWKHKADFVPNYVEMVETFQALDGKPTVWICYPVPVFPERWGVNDKTLKGEVIPLIGNVAEKTGVHVIDLYQPLSGKPELFPDKVHPNTAGAKVIAETIFAAITGKTPKRAEPKNAPDKK